MKRILNLGCGAKLLPNAVNADVFPYAEAVCVVDLAKFPWPWADAAFDEVHAYMFLEHVSNLVMTMDEIHRICSPGGLLTLTVPYWTGPNSWDDPTHVRCFTSQTFRWFTPQSGHSAYMKEHMQRRTWDVVETRIQVSAALPILDLVPRIMGGVYERFFAHVLPAQGMKVVMRALKEPDAARG
ncbi:MAG: class I SAM-dependent methyltransferase [Verrucomicrobia bacterium]|nr:class I SAM-dependent methyltransferase [Verrucomicrobiota bacterium]